MGKPAFLTIFNFSSRHLFIFFSIFNFSPSSWPIIYLILSCLIRHRAVGRIGVTSAVGSFVHSRSSTSFQVQPSASVLRGSRLSSRWSPRLHLGMFLRGGHGVSLRRAQRLPPPPWAHIFAILSHLGALGRYLGSSWRSQATSCRQVAPRWCPDGPT